MTLRVVQVGLGGFGRSWAGLVRAAPEVALVAVVDTAPAAREWAAAELGLPPDACHPDLDAALAAHAADAAIVATPPPTHRTVAAAALAAGKHVLVEKPLATTMADARDLAAAADRAGRTLMVSQNYRFSGHARAARATVAAGALGDLLAVRIRFRRDSRAIFPPGDFRYQMAHPLVLDMAIHHFDLLRAITGRDPVAVHARSWPVPDSPYAHDPAVIALITLDGGATVSYDGDWAPHDPDTSWNGDWELLGTEGRLTWTGGATADDPPRLRLSRWGEATVAVPPHDAPADGRRATLAALAEAVASGESPETAAADNIKSLALTLGCVASIERHALVDLARLVADG